MIDFYIGDKVKWITSDGSEVYRGQLVKLTTIGGYIYKPRRREGENDGDVSSETCEWYPFNCNNGKMVKI